MNPCHRSLLASAVCLMSVSGAQADGGAMLLEHQLDIDSTHAVVTDYRVDGMYTLHETLRNRSTAPWRTLLVELVRQAGGPTEFAPVTPAEGVSFMAAEPTAAWRPTLEARIDGVYLGLAGGGWQVQRLPGATALRIDFLETPVAPGQTLELRLRVLNTHDTTWRLRYAPGGVSVLN